MLGSEHPDIAISLDNLARLFTAQGDFEAARPLFERAQTIFEKVLGTKHPDTERVRDNLRSPSDAASRLP